MAGHWRAFQRAVLREIRVSDDAAVFFHVSGNLLGDLTFVERVGATLLNGTQRVRIVLVEEAITGTRHLAIRQINLRRLGPLLEEAASFSNARRQSFIKDVAFVGE